MQFVISTKRGSPPPPATLLPLNDAMVAWRSAAGPMMEPMGGQS